MTRTAGSASHAGRPVAGSALVHRQHLTENFICPAYIFFADSKSQRPPWLPQKTSSRAGRQEPDLDPAGRRRAERRPSPRTASRSPDALRFALKATIEIGGGGGALDHRLRRPGDEAVARGAVRRQRAPVPRLSARLIALGVTGYDPRDGGYSKLFAFLRSLQTTEERSSAGYLTGRRCPWRGWARWPDSANARATARARACSAWRS